MAILGQRSDSRRPIIKEEWSFAADAPTVENFETKGREF